MPFRKDPDLLQVAALEALIGRGESFEDGSIFWLDMIKKVGKIYLYTFSKSDIFRYQTVFPQI